MSMQLQIKIPHDQLSTVKDIIHENKCIFINCFYSCKYRKYIFLPITKCVNSSIYISLKVNTSDLFFTGIYYYATIIPHTWDYLSTGWHQVQESL